MQPSRVTGVIDEDLVFIDFGKHEGRRVSEIAEIDQEFYESLAKQTETGMLAIRRHKDKKFRLYLNLLNKTESKAPLLEL
jgi:broad specificity phosphatase PhoE